jgi:TldD protein
VSAPRLPLSSELILLQQRLGELLPLLQARTDWYSSIYFERKVHRSVAVNFKETQVGDSLSAGVVFRIYDGFTLHEWATDQLDLAHLREGVQRFVKRVESRTAPVGITPRFYQAPSWSDRLKQVSEQEISEQLPTHFERDLSVHFGIRYQKDPRAHSVEESVTSLRQNLKKMRSVAEKKGLSDADFSFAVARHSLTDEESFFIDREVRLSQRLPRLAVTLVGMSGANRAIHRVGGLGGLEVLDVDESDIERLIEELVALRSAQRLEPGQYRVLFGPELAGVIAHEAFGHSQEGDTCARGRSKAWELYQAQTRVGNQHATILNNPAIFRNGDRSHGAWGSYFFDEEGWLASAQTLLSEGLLRAPMTHLTSAIRLGIPRTANGKRESWSSGVYTRQTNTYFSPGSYTLQELIGKLGNGYIATQSAGGMEDPKGMGIQVGIAWLQEVKDGKLTGRVFRGPAGGDVQFTGYVPDVLQSIVAKSKIDAESLELDRSQFPPNDAGGCGKYHKEYVHAGCGGPWMLLDSVRLG